jgi:UrcA family protein
VNTLTTVRVRVAWLVVGSFAGILAAGAAGATNVGGGADGGVPSVVVKYDAASLATAAGVNDLYRRIMYAAKKVCPDASIRDLGGQQRVEECRNQAVSRAIRQIDNSQLAALYASHAKNG